MTKLLIALFTVLIPFSVLRAQMKIGDNSTTINSNSILELETINKGLVMPRVALTNVTSPSPLSNTLLTGTVVYNTNSVITGGSGTGIYLWTGTNWTLLTTSATLVNNVWALAGNASTSSAINFVGTKDNAGLSFRTNNIRRMLLDSLGNLAIGTTAFDAVDRERLLVDNTGTNSRTLATLRGNINDYLQVNVQNTNSGNNASSDYVATADNGTDSTFYIDMGINSSTYTPSVDNFGGPNDGYLYTYARHLVIGTQATGSDLIFLVSGGSIKNNQAMRIIGTNGNIIFGRGDNTISPLGNTLRAPNALTTGTNITGGTLTILGGKSTGTATGGSVNITGGSTGTGTGGAVNINVSSNNATNINTGTSASDVTIGNALNNINLPKLSASSVVITDGVKNLASTSPSNNTYLYYNGANFTWATASSSLASLTNGSGISSLNYNGSSGASVSLANGTSAGQVYVTGASPFTPALVNMNGDATINSSGSLSLATVNGNIGTFNNVTVNAKGLVTSASNTAYTTLGSFSATAPLSYNSGTGVFSISQANTSTNGYVTSADWNTFNNKVGSITLNTPSTVFTNPVNFSVSGGSATGTLSLNTQSVNTVFAGPASGAAATPTFRALVAADIPSLAANYIQNQTTQQASSNFNISGNGTIGTNLAVTGTSTLTGAVTSNGGITNSGILTSSGNAINLNAGSSFTTNINTGTNTAAVAIGGTGNTVTLGTNNAGSNINVPKLSATSVVITDASKNLSSSAPSNNTYLYYNGTNFTWQSPASAWNITGNSGTTASTAAIGSAVNNNFIGNTDAKDWVVATNNLERMRVASNGNIGINTITPGALVDVQGTGVTTTNVANINGSALTTGNGLSLTANALTSGNGINVSSTSAAGTASSSSALINLSRSGANAGTAHTAYGIFSSVTNTNATSGTNIAGYFSSSGATTNNYALYGTTATNTGTGIYGINSAAAGSAAGIGIFGTTAQNSGYGVQGNNTATSGSSTGVYGTVSYLGITGSAYPAGVVGKSTASSGTGSADGVDGYTSQSGGQGLFGKNYHSNGTGVAGNGSNASATLLLAGGSGGAFTGVTTGLYANTLATTTAGGGYTSPVAGVYGESNASGIGASTDLYQFGVYGVKEELNNTSRDKRSGGVLGVLYNTTSSTFSAWGSLGYLSNSSIQYGVYATTALGIGLGGKPLGENNATAGIGLGSYGGVMGAWVRGDVYGLTVKGNRYGMYVDGYTYTNKPIVQLVDNGTSLRTATYTVSSVTPDIYAHGKERLLNGKAIIEFDKSFQQIVDASQDISITVTPIGDGNGIHLSQYDAKGFIAEENRNADKSSGTSNIQFTWIAIGARKDVNKSEVADEVLSKDFNSNINNVMSNETDQNARTSSIWWTGRNVSFTPPPENVFSNGVKSLQPKKIIIKK